MLKKLGAMVGSVVLASSTIINPLLPLVAEANNEETYQVIGKNNKLTSMTKSQLDSLKEFDSYKVKGYNIVNQVQDSATPSERDKYVVLNYDLDDYYDKGGSCYTKCPPETLFTAVQDMRKGGERWGETGMPGMTGSLGNKGGQNYGSTEYNAQHLPTYHAILSNNIEKKSIEWNMDYFTADDFSYSNSIFGAKFSTTNDKYTPKYKFSNLVPLKVYAVNTKNELVELGSATVKEETNTKLHYNFNINPDDIYQKLGVKPNSVPIQLVAKFAHYVTNNGYVNTDTPLLAPPPNGQEKLYKKFNKNENIDGEGQWISYSGNGDFTFTRLEMVATSSLENVIRKKDINICNGIVCEVGTKDVASVKPTYAQGYMGNPGISGIAPLNISKYVFGNTSPNTIDFEYDGIVSRDDFDRNPLVVNRNISIKVDSINEYMKNPPKDLYLVKTIDNNPKSLLFGTRYELTSKSSFETMQKHPLPNVITELVDINTLSNEDTSLIPSHSKFVNTLDMYMVDNVKEKVTKDVLTYTFDLENPNALPKNKAFLVKDYDGYLIDTKTNELKPITDYYTIDDTQQYNIRKLNASKENIRTYERKQGTPFGSDASQIISDIKDGKKYPILTEISNSQNESIIPVINIYKDKYNVTKEWQNSKGEKIASPVKEILVNVLNNGIKVDTLTLSENNNWSASFEEYPFTLKEEKFKKLSFDEIHPKILTLNEEDINRNVITFEEVKVPNFDTSITVTNDLDVNIVNKETANTCTNFTVNVKENGSNVKITSKDNSTFFEGKVVNGKVVTDKPLVVGEEYTIEVTKDGYVTETVKHIAVKDNCETTVTINETPNTCTNFTVHVNENGSNVKITSKDNSTFFEGKVVNGKVVTDKPLVVGEEYTIEVTKDGFVTQTVKHTAVKDNCETTVTINETPNTCTNFTVNVNENGSNVKITDDKGIVFYEGKVTNNKVITDKPLVVGEKYNIEVTKDGYSKNTIEVTAQKDDCEITLNLVETPNKCTNFTVNVNEENANVKITDEKGAIFYEGKVTNKKVVTDKPLVVGKEYTVTVTKDGYVTETKTIVSAKDDCETTIILVEKPNTCVNFTVITNINGSDVKITSKDNSTFFEGKVTNGKVVTDKPLVVGEEYTITVSKDGYVTETVKYTAVKDDCETTVTISETPNTCTNFTVEVNEENAKVVIKDSSDKVFYENTVTNGKVVTDKPLVVGEEYTIIVTKDGFVTETVKHTAVKDNCETTVTISETPNTCTNFTVEVNEENAKVVITDSNDNVFYENTVTNGEVVTDKPLVVGEEYTITVTKDGFVTETIKYTPVKDECTVEVTINENPNVCTDFTVNVNVDGANVKITTKDGKIFYEGIVVNGKVITDKPLDVNETYTIKVTKDNYVTKSVEHTAVKDMCATTISLDKKPTTPTTPVNPNKCDTFTIKIENKQGAIVELKEKDTNIIVENAVIHNNQVIFTQPLEHGKSYVVEFTFDGVKTTKEVIGDKDICEITLEDNVTPPVVEDKNKCENFTVVTNKNNVTVQIKDSKDNVVSEGKSTDNKYVYNQPLLVGETYTIVVLDNDKVIGKKDVTIEKDICETTVTIEEPKEENKCENHTITINQKNTEVVVTENGKEIFNGKVTDNKIVFDKPFDSTKEYKVKVKKSGYKVYNEKITVKDGNCVTEIELSKKPSGGGGHYVCPRYEVETSIANTTVKIYNNDKLVEEGKTDKDGHYVIKSDLEYRGEYTYKFTKDGYNPVTVTKEVNAVDCLVTVTMEKDTTPTPPKPVEPTKPYNPDEEPVEEDKPTPIPPTVEEKPTPVPPTVEEDKPTPIPPTVEVTPTPPTVEEKPTPPTVEEVVNKPIIESVPPVKESTPPTVETVNTVETVEKVNVSDLPQTNTVKSYALAVGIMLTIGGLLLLVIRNRKVA